MKIARTLIANKKLQFVVDERPTQRSAELVAAQSIVIGIGRHAGSNPVVRVHGVIAQEVKNIAVEVVAAGLGHDIHDRARMLPISR